VGGYFTAIDGGKCLACGQGKDGRRVLALGAKRMSERK